MLKKLVQHGNDLVLVIEKPILELLGADSKTVFNMKTDGACLILTPVKNNDQGERVMKEVEKINNKYHEVLKKLAD